MNFKKLKPATRTALREGHAKLRTLQAQVESGGKPTSSALMSAAAKGKASRAAHTSRSVPLGRAFKR